MLMLTSKSQATRANTGDTATGDGNVLLVEHLVHVGPAVAGLDNHSLLVGGELDCLHALKRDGDAALDVGGSCERSMSTALDGEGALRQAREQDCDGDIFLKRGLEDALRRDRRLLERPESTVESTVALVIVIKDCVAPVKGRQCRTLLCHVVSHESGEPDADQYAHHQAFREIRLTAIEQASLLERFSRPASSGISVTLTPRSSSAAETSKSAGS